MRKYGIGFVCFLATLMVALVTGCGQEMVTIPGVVSVTPAQGATGVPVNTVVTATFNMAMNPTSITTSTFTLAGPGGAAITGAVTYSGKVATLTPSANLAVGTTYTATVTTGASSPGGAELIGNFVWTFSTVGASVPSVVSVTPPPGAASVLLNATISATFSQAMSAASINATTFTVAAPGGLAVTGTVSLSANGLVATFMPTAGILTSGTTFTATVTTGAKSTSGIPLAANYVWTFTTMVPTVPMVVSVTPVQGAANVAVNAIVSANFSEAMSPASISASTFTVAAPGGAAVTGTVSLSANGLVATFMPAGGMLANKTTYTATITAGAMSTGGIPLAADYVWTFTTITPPPMVVFTVPADTATGVPLSQVIRARFNEAMMCSTLASPAINFMVTGPGATAVAGTVTCTGSVATFTPGAALAVNTLYTATIKTGAQDLAGTAMAANYMWTFRTVPAPPVAPTVISTVPIDLATGVPPNQILSATFSEAMDPATINSATFLLKVTGGANVDGVIAYVPAGSVATFAPVAQLAPSTKYTATVTSGALDLNDDAGVVPYTWTFTTAPAAVKIPPTVVSTIPLDMAIDVPLNQVVSATFSQAMNAATISSATFKLTGPGMIPVSGLVAYAAIAKQLVFLPAANLVASTLYTATITTGAQNLAGDGLVVDYVWTFTTSATVVVVPPELVSTDPANLSTDVPLNQAVSATFSKAMDPLTLTSATYQLTQGGTLAGGGTLIPATITYDAINFIATLTPTNPLTASTVYTVLVTTGATDLAGNPLGNSGALNPWTFMTGAVVVPPPVILGPTISLFGGFGGTAGMTNQGIDTIVNGYIGTTAVSTLITGFHDTTVVVGGVNECTYTETPLNIGLVNGTINTAPPPPTVGCPNEGTAATFAVATQASAEALTAYNTLAAIPNGIDVATLGGGAGELGNRTLAAGVYKSAPGSYAISMGDLTLDAKGNPDASWVFQMATTLTVGTPSSHRSVLLVNGAKAANVYWQVGTAATINGILGGGTMKGTIVSQAGVSISTAGVTSVATLDGRALALIGPVTMVNTVINVPTP